MSGDINNRALRELLRKKKEGLPLDDFEKEALDGFALLEDDEDAIRLKEMLDVRMHSEVINEKRSRSLYWIAAAAMLIIVGSSAYFLLTSENVTPAKEMSITSSVPEFRSSIPAPEPVITEGPSAEQKVSEHAQKKSPPQIVAITQPPAPTEDKKQDNDPPAADQNYDGMAVASSGAVNAAKEVAMESAESTAPAAAPPAEMMKSKKTMNATRSNQSSSNDIATGVMYEGGENKLHSSIRESLSDKNITKGFSSMLEIKSDKVTGVEFLYPLTLSKEEQRTVRDILFKLGGFRSPDANEKYSFRIDYKP